MNQRFGISFPAGACLLLVLSLSLSSCSREPEPVASDLQRDLRAECPKWANRSVDTALVESSELVTAGTPAREYCLLTAAFQNSRLRFNVWLPTEGWNQRMAFMGGGGFDGMLMDKTFVLVFSPSAVTEGYALVSTNGGYDAPDSINPLAYFDAEFASDPEALADFMYRSEHRALPLANQVVEGFYGRAPEFRYYEGCSMGGHDAMLLSQRYPDDFDGIIARAPAGNIVGLLLQFNRVGSHLKNHDSALDEDQRNLLANAMLAQCDDRDGLADGTIAWPGACAIDLATFICSARQTTTCLSPIQAELVNTATTPLNVAEGEFTHPGYPLDGINQDAGWGEYIWPKMLGYSVQMLFAQGFVRSFVTRDPGYDSWQWNPEQWLPELRAIAAEYNAVNPDLTKFHDAGGKLILWNGMLDASVSSLEIAQYYEAMIETMGAEAVEDTAELFLSPGVGHCRSGPGPDRADLLAALSTWVEKDTPPSQQNLVAFGLNEAGEIDRSLPLCKYPSYPRYQAGEASNSASYTCAVD